MYTHLFDVVKRNSLAIVLTVIALLAFLLITEDSGQRATTLVLRLGAISENRSHLNNLIKSVQDADTWQRRYVTTGREEFLTTYHAALINVADAFAQLDGAYSQEPRSAELLKKLHALTETKLSELAMTVQMQKGGKRQIGVDIALSGNVHGYVDAIREIETDLLAVELSRLQESQREVFDMLLYIRACVALLMAISLALLLRSMRHHQAFNAQQETHQQAMKAAREHLQSEVTRRTLQLSELNQYMQTAREDERHRIARDLHDELGALLTTAKLDVARIKSRLGTSSPEVLERVNHLIETLNAGIAMKRQIIEDLWPSTLSNLGLIATLEILGREFTKNTGIPLHCALRPAQLNATAELVIYRLVQEATTNIAKYARARNCWLSMTTKDGHNEVMVRDDGVGFDSNQIGKIGHGLLGMQFRVKAEGGELEVVSDPGKGTQIRARFPATGIENQ